MSSLVATRVPTTPGNPSSRLTMAAWHVLPPASVIEGRGSTERRHPVGRGHLGDEYLSVDELPALLGAGEDPDLRPLARPRPTPSPRSSTFRSDRVGRNVIGRDCTNQQIVADERPLDVLRAAVVLLDRDTQFRQLHDLGGRQDLGRGACGIDGCDLLAGVGAHQSRRLVAEMDLGQSARSPDRRGTSRARSCRRRRTRRARTRPRSPASRPTSSVVNITPDRSLASISCTTTAIAGSSVSSRSAR